MRLFKKINASALQYTLLVSVVIAILIGSFLTLTHIRSFFGMQSDQLLQVVENSNAGIIYALKEDIVISDSIAIPTENATTFLSRKTWGGFSILKSRSSIKTKTFEKVCLVGMHKKNNRDAVYLTELRQPLVLVGDSEIQGDAYLSDRGIKAGVISGKYFKGKELIRGKVKSTSGTLPKLDINWRNDINGLIDYIPLNEAIIPINETQKNSFKEQTKVIYSREKLVVQEEYIGNILIKSDTEIIVDQFARLQDVFLIAPKITLQKGFKGSAHFLAEETIFLEDNVTLTYPSSIVVNKKEELDIENITIKTPISISQNSVINGLVIFLNHENEPETNTIAATIDENVTINGQVYIEGNTQLYGLVNGTVYSERFITNKFGSRYINHLFDGKVLNRGLENAFCGLPLINYQKGIAKWLY